MIDKPRSGFTLLEAVLTVLIASICLTFIVQSLLTNYRTSLRFQQNVRSLIVMENRLGLLLATSAARDELDPSPVSLDYPYDKFTVSARTDTLNTHLDKIELQLNWPIGRAQGHLNTTTIVYNPNENYTGNPAS